MHGVFAPQSHAGGIDLGNGVELVLWRSGWGWGANCCKCMGDVIDDDPAAFSIKGMFGSRRNFHSGSCARCEWCDSMVSVAQRNFRPVSGTFGLRHKIKCLRCCQRDNDVNVVPVVPPSAPQAAEAAHDADLRQEIPPQEPHMVAAPASTQIQQPPAADAEPAAANSVADAPTAPHAQTADNAAGSSVAEQGCEAARDVAGAVDIKATGMTPNSAQEHQGAHAAAIREPSASSPTQQCFSIAEGSDFADGTMKSDGQSSEILGASQS